MPDKWNVPFDKQQIKIFRELVDANAETPYAKPWSAVNWLWLSQAVSAMEQGLEDK